MVLALRAIVALLRCSNMVQTDLSRSAVQTGALAVLRPLDSAQCPSVIAPYASWFIGILIGQLLLMNVTFFCVGLGFLAFSQWSLNLYMGGTLAEVFGVILIITKNLFPKKGS